jgi:ABC-2 type transport system ATP-binding protein
MPATAVVEFERVTKDYPLGLTGRRCLRALDQVSFSVARGEVFGLVGPNRAGKTTLIKILLALCRPTSGNVLRLGQPLKRRATLARIGYLHERQAFPPYLSARDILQYYGALALVPHGDLRQRVPALLEQVGLADRADEPISRYSKGMIARLGLAQALVGNPELLVLDEPTEGLDLAGKQLVRDTVHEQRRQGKTVLMVSHAAAELEALCDRAAVIVGGKLAFQGTLAELTADPADGVRRPIEQALSRWYQGNPA